MSVSLNATTDSVKATTTLTTVDAKLYAERRTPLLVREIVSSGVSNQITTVGKNPGWKAVRVASLVPAALLEPNVTSNSFVIMLKFELL